MGFEQDSNREEVQVMKNNLILSEVSVISARSVLPHRSSQYLTDTLSSPQNQKSPLLQDFLAQAHLNYTLSRHDSEPALARNADIIFYPVTAVQHAVDRLPLNAPRRLELPEGEDVEYDLVGDMDHFLGAVALPQKSPMWAFEVNKEAELASSSASTPRPSGVDSSVFFSESMFHGENNGNFFSDAINTIDSAWGKSGTSDTTGDEQDDPSRIINSFLNSDVEDAWTPLPNNVPSDLPPVLTPGLPNTIPGDQSFMFGDYQLLGEGDPPPEHVTARLPEPATPPHAPLPPPEDPFSLSELDCSLPPPPKQPRCEGAHQHAFLMDSGPALFQSPVASPVSLVSDLGSAHSPASTAGGGVSVVWNSDGSQTVDVENTVQLKVPRPHEPSVTLDRDKLIDMPVEEFNVLLQASSLSESGVAFMKEWRRKGKNKKAAQIARKRKRDEMGGLEGEVQLLKEAATAKEEERAVLLQQLRECKRKCEVLEDQLLARYSHERGTSYSRESHRLFLMGSQSAGKLHAFVMPYVAAAAQ